LPTSAELLLFDTSAALALTDRINPLHDAVWAQTKVNPRGLSGHAAFEFLSVLTRMPLPRRLDATQALNLIRNQFPQSRFLTPSQSDALLDDFVRAGIVGGAVYDGLVGACAKAHGLPLITCDRRAEITYRALGVDYRLI
jgi:predicted nucleic acid-binding protein